MKAALLAKRIKYREEEEEEEVGKEEGMGRKRKVEEEIYTSSDEADVQRREAEASGGFLVTLMPDVVDLEETVKWI